MESRKFTGIEMLKASWAFIKEQLRVVDSWFLIAFISFLALFGCILGVMLLVGMIGIGFFLFHDYFLSLSVSPWSMLLSATLIFLVLALVLFISYKALKCCMGFWNLVVLNSLDAAFKRPMRKFEQKDERLSFMILFILVGLLTVVGFLLLIVPGVIFMVRTSMAYPIMLEEKCSPLEAISKSFDITRGNFWPLLISLLVFRLFLWLPFINIINVIVPIASWSIASLYMQLKNR